MTQRTSDEKNVIEQIDAEISKSEQLQNSVPDNVGMLSIKTANRAINDARLKPDPVKLYYDLWIQDEICCLFAESNVGKSILAVQIGNHIAKAQKVLYFDFELSEKKFQMRYTNEDNVSYKFPDNFMRVELNPDNTPAEDFENALLNDIQTASEQTGAKVLIIDNITWLCVQGEKAEIVGSFMKKLKQLRNKYDLSILVLAHTRKRYNLCNPISQDDLAGSKLMMNFIDSAFTIGKSAKNSEWRYIKQIKVRDGAYIYDSENVVICEIVQENSFLQMKQTKKGYSTEREHLNEWSYEEQKLQDSNVLTLKGKGMSERQIAQELGINKSRVHRILTNGSGGSDGSDGSDGSIS